MKKVGQRNWLLFITGLLLIGAIISLWMTAGKRFGVGMCVYDGIEYSQGDSIVGYDDERDCSCSWTGDIVCEDREAMMNYETFSSSSLSFSYNFRNYIEKNTPDLSKVSLIDVNHLNNRLEISIEREALCGEGDLSPTQIGLYERKSGSIILTTITNRDEALYSKVCIIGNSFMIENLDTMNDREFSIMYQNESGQLYDLNVCYLNNRLYGKGDVFKDGNRLCTCEGPEVSCDRL